MGDGLKTQEARRLAFFRLGGERSRPLDVGVGLWKIVDNNIDSGYY